MKHFQVHGLIIVLCLGLNTACQDSPTIEYDRSGSNQLIYVGDSSLKGTFYKNQIHVVSNQTLVSVTFSINGTRSTALTTNQISASVRSWHTNSFNFANGDLITADAKFANSTQKRLEMKVVRNGNDIRLVDINQSSSSNQQNNTLPFYQGDNPTPNNPVDNSTPNNPPNNNNNNGNNGNDGNNNNSGNNDPYNGTVANNEVDVNEYMQKFNEYRSQHGLSPMKLSRELTQAAADNNPGQISQGASSHNTNYGYAEIAFYGPDSIEYAIQGWHDSGGHRELMQGDYNCTGIHRQEYAWTQVFSNSSDCEY